MISKPLATSLVVLLLVLGLAALVQWRAGTREQAAETAFPPSGQFVDVDGTDIHLKITGQGPDIVLIHGANGSLRDFTFDLVDRLTPRFRVIAVDRPGLGWSARPEGFGGAFNNRDEPPALQARLLQAATDTVGVENPIVLGHSYGGAIALAWALERPDQTAGLVLVGAASNPWEGKLGFLYQMNASSFGSAIAIPLITAFVPQTTIEDAVTAVFAPQTAPKGYMKGFGTEMTLRRKTMRANAQQVNSLKPYVTEMSTRYPTLTLPVESVHGTLDDTVPLRTHAEPLTQQIPGAVLTRLEGVGHMPHHTNPEVIIAAIDRVAARAGLR